MSKHSARQSDDQITEPSQQLWTSAACPTVDHDARPECEVSSTGRPPLSLGCVGIMAAAGGIAVANLYYNQPMLPDVGRSFGVAANVIALLPMSTQIGYALGQHHQRLDAAPLQLSLEKLLLCGSMTHLEQFLCCRQRIRGRRSGPEISFDGGRPAALQLQRMPELQVDVGVIRRLRERRTVSSLGLGKPADLFEHVAVLNPDVTPIRRQVDGGAVGVSGGCVLARVAKAIRPLD